MNIIIALVIASVLWPAVLLAAEGEREREWKKDIAACVEKVRQMGLGYSFDAYATPGFRVKYFGTQREMFQFDKCMAEKGQYLSDK